MKESFSLFAAEDLIAQATNVQELGWIKTNLFLELNDVREKDRTNLSKMEGITKLLHACSNKINDILNQK